MKDPITGEAMTCASCRFRQPDPQNRPQYIDAGFCHRFPPQLVPMEQVRDGRGTDVEAWRPWVQPDDWCGEYQPDIATQMGQDNGR